MSSQFLSPSPQVFVAAQPRRDVVYTFCEFFGGGPKAALPATNAAPVVSDAGPAGPPPNPPAVEAATDEPVPNTPLAMWFLKQLDPDGRHDLYRIDPDLPAREARTFFADQRAETAAWIDQQQGRRNVYFTVNRGRGRESINERLSASDIGEIRAIGADVDPQKAPGGDPTGEHFRRERERLFQLAKKMHDDPLCPATMVVDTGGGIQALWILEEPVPATAENIALAEGIGRAIQQMYGGDSVFDMPRILRVPGTINVLSPEKRAQGRQPATATVLYVTEERYELGQLKDWVPPISAKQATPKAKGQPGEQIDIGAVQADNYDELPAELRAKFEALCDERRRIGQLWRGGWEPKDASASGRVYSLASQLRHAGTFTITEFAQLVAVWQFRSIQHADDFERYVSRAWNENHVPRFVHIPNGGFNPVDLPEDAALGSLGGSAGRVSAADWDPPENLWHATSAPPDLPVGVVPPIIEELARDQARRLGVEAAAPAAALVTALGSLVPAGNQLQIRQRDTGWKVKSVLWMALIGAPGTNKSALLSYATDPVRHVEATWRKQYAAEKRKFEAHETALKATGKKTPDAPASEPADADDLWRSRPTLRRKMVNDATTEAVAKILSENSSGLLLSLDELSGHFGSMDAYHQRAGKDRSFWLEAKEGGQHTVDRRTSDTILIENLAVSVVGGIQPEKIKGLSASLSEDGMLQRFMPIIIRRTGMGEDVSPDAALADAINQLAGNLTASTPNGLYRFSPEADKELRALADFVAQEIARPELSMALRQWLDKMPNEFGRLALIFHFIEWHASDVPMLTGDPPPELVSAETARRARRFLQELVYPHARAFHEQVLGVSPTEEHAQWIAGFILARGKSLITDRDIYRSYPALKDKENRGGIVEAMHVLELSGWAQPIKWGKAGKPTHWNVNPAVHKLYSERAQEERARRLEARESIQRAAEQRRAERGAGPDESPPAG
jgi:hypothetical protein